MTRDIAHVSFERGGACFPARTPYDRELLAEHVLHRVQRNGLVQLLLNGERWLMERPQASVPCRCGACGAAVDVRCTAPDTGEPPHCLTCVLDGRRGFDAGEENDSLAA